MFTSIFRACQVCAVYIYIYWYTLLIWVAYICMYKYIFMKLFTILIIYI